MGEAYIYLVAGATPEVSQPVEAMLEVAAYPDFGIASMSFLFWAKLAKQLRPRRRPPDAATRFSAPQQPPPPPDAAETERQRRVEFFAVRPTVLWGLGTVCFEWVWRAVVVLENAQAMGRMSALGTSESGFMVVKANQP